MLNEIKKDHTYYARQLTRPYESYSIDELADAYCDATDNNNEILKNVYVSALILRFWYTIDKMYKANTAQCLEYYDFYCWLYDAIEYACKYRGWKDPSKKVNAQQCINQCICTISRQKYYDLNLDKRKIVNFCNSLDAPVCGGEGDDAVMTLGDTLEADDVSYDFSTSAVTSLIQTYINNNKVIEAILIDNIISNDVQKHFKKTIKTVNSEGETVRYTEHSSQFWPYKLVQIVSKLPDTYKKSFMRKYSITEEKLTAVLDIIDRANNQKLYKYLDRTLAELRVSYAQ